MAALTSILRSPTFFVGSNSQRGILETFHKEEQHLEESYTKNKPLCFSGRSYQKTHPDKARNGHRDADATLHTPVILGVADGVSQVEEYGMDASLLPHELLRMCEEIAMSQMMPNRPNPEDPYRGPIPLLKEAYETTESLGSTTVVLSLLDNSTMIHGKLHPMMAVITVGDCELLVLRRTQGRTTPLEAVFHTEMQRIDGHVQTPLQLARVNDLVDPDFDESVTIEVIERGSAVHCVSAYEGDIVVMGSDGVFDNLFLDELVEICNAVLAPRNGKFEATSPTALSLLARKIVDCSHAKTKQGARGELPEAPIGRGGKTDDTSCVVAEIIEWTEDHDKIFAPKGGRFDWVGSLVNSMSCGANGCSAHGHETDEFDYDNDMAGVGAPRSARHGLPQPQHSSRAIGGDPKLGLRESTHEESDMEPSANCAIS